LAPAQANERRPPTAALLPVLDETINLGVYNFDCGGSAIGCFAGFAFSIAKIDCPSPTAALKQLDDSVFHSSIFHRNRLIARERFSDSSGGRQCTCALNAI
jgi:hypothetical protein